jgi:hypothetical protein
VVDLLERGLLRRQRAYPVHQAEILREGSDVAILGIGSEVSYCVKAAERLALEGLNVTVVNARFVKPLDTALILALARSHGAIVTAEHHPDERIMVTGIERFGYVVEPIVARLTELSETTTPEAGVIDAEGLGDAVWELLDGPRRPWQLYAKHGTERQALTRTLLVVVARDRLRFGEVDEAEAMKRAMLALTRDPREDGPGSDLTVALALAVGSFRKPPPRIF